MILLYTDLRVYSAGPIAPGYLGVSQGTRRCDEIPPVYRLRRRVCGYSRDQLEELFFRLARADTAGDFWNYHVTDFCLAVPVSSRWLLAVADDVLHVTENAGDVSDPATVWLLSCLADHTETIEIAALEYCLTKRYRCGIAEIYAANQMEPFLAEHLPDASRRERVQFFNAVVRRWSTYFEIPPPPSGIYK